MFDIGGHMQIFSSPQKRIRFFILLFIIGLTLSGISAIPALSEATLLKQFFGSSTWLGEIFPGIAIWFDRIYEGVHIGYGQYPFLAYGTDWLAFGHIAIAIAFIGPLRDPIKNIWVIEFGMIACVLVVPWAIVFSFVRDIPIFWTLIDISFGIFGIIPLWFVRRDIISLNKINSAL
jgi:hypothetical protein